MLWRCFGAQQRQQPQPDDRGFVETGSRSGQAEREEAVREFVAALKVAVHTGQVEVHGDASCRNVQQLQAVLDLFKGSAISQPGTATAAAAAPPSAPAAGDKAAVEAMLCASQCVGGLITVFGMDGNVIYQNQSSCNYMGDLVGKLAPGSDLSFNILGPGSELQLGLLPEQHPLQQLFGHGSGARLWQRKKLLAGEVFRQLLTVPLSMKPQHGVTSAQSHDQQHLKHPPCITNDLLLGSSLWNEVWPHQEGPLPPEQGATSAPGQGRKALTQRFHAVQQLVPRPCLDSVVANRPPLTTSKPRDVADPASTSSSITPNTSLPKITADYQGSINLPPGESAELAPTTLQAGANPNSRRLWCQPTPSSPSPPLRGLRNAARVGPALTSFSGARANNGPEDHGKNRMSAGFLQQSLSGAAAALVIAAASTGGGDRSRRKKLHPQRSNSLSNLGSPTTSKLRSLSVTDWDRRAMFAMPTVCVNVEDAASRQLLLQSHMNTNNDSCTNSTAEPSQVLESYKLHLLQQSSFRTTSEAGANHPYDGSGTLHARAINCRSVDGIGTLHGRGWRGGSYGQCPIQEDTELDATMVPAGQQANASSLSSQICAKPGGAETADGWSVPRAAINTAGSAVSELDGRHAWASPALYRPRSHLQSATASASRSSNPSNQPLIAIAPCSGSADSTSKPFQGSRAPKEAEGLFADLASTALDATHAPIVPVTLAERIRCSGARGLDSAPTLDSQEGHFEQMFESIDGGEYVRATDGARLSAVRWGNSSSARYDRTVAAAAAVTAGARRYKRAGTLERLSRMLTRMPVKEVPGPDVDKGEEDEPGVYAPEGLRPLSSMAVRDDSMHAARHQQLRRSVDSAVMAMTASAEINPHSSLKPASSAKVVDAMSTQQPHSSVLGVQQAVSSPDDGTIVHEVCLQLVPCTSVCGHQLLLVLTQHELQHRMSGALLQLLREEHKLLENIFPKHVLWHIVKRVRAGMERQGAATAVNDTSAATFTNERDPCLTFSLTKELKPSADHVGPASYHSMVTVCFCDIVGFTEMCKHVEPIVVMDFLNSLYTRFDAVSDIYRVYKLETIGDCYVAASGLFEVAARSRKSIPIPPEEQARMDALKAISFAKALLLEATTVLMPLASQPVILRVGLHSGPVMSGIVGNKMPRLCLFGDTVNTTSRMESTCPHETVQISADTWRLLDAAEQQRWYPTGGVQVKGKGEMMTYTWSWHSESVPRNSA